jgi:tryptophan synthase beta chain
MTTTILDELVTTARARARQAARGLPLSELRRQVAGLPPARGFEASLRYADRLGLVAEIKRSSPSAGMLGAVLDGPVAAGRLAAEYAAAGARCLSVLTEPSRFGGSDEDLTEATGAGIPILRKDFVTETYQVLQARMIGADAVLLIARILPDDRLTALLEQAAEAGLDALVEVHSEEELERALNADATLIGVNARDLATLKVDVAHILPLLRTARAAGATVVAESGLASAADLRRVAAAGAHAALVGTSLLSGSRPAGAARKMAGAAPRIRAALPSPPARPERLAVKVCGLRTAAGVRFANAAGADFAGFVMAPGARRRVAPAQVRELVDDLAGPQPVLVFRRPTRSQVTEAVSTSAVRNIQVSGLDRPPRWLCQASTELNVVIGVLHAGGTVRDTLGLAEEWLRAGATHILLEGATRADGGGTASRVPLATARRLGFLLPIGIAGGLRPRSIAAAVGQARPAFVDASSGLERNGITDPRRLAAFVHNARRDITGAWEADKRGRFGRFGGRYVPETLLPALEELEAAWADARRDPGFMAELRRLHHEFIGRPTPLFEVPASVMAAIDAPGRRLFLKREDLAHTGAHKINNAIGQVLLAVRMGRRRIIAETGAGQHGVATATACALFGLECIVYMGTTDIDRQAPNVARMELLGAEVRPVAAGNGTLRDALNEALRDWVANVRTTAYVLGSAAGPHPYPTMVAQLQAVIGQEARAQILEQAGRLPTVALACIGGGSNAIGLFGAFLDTPTRLIGVEAGGRGDALGDNAASLGLGRPGVLHGAFTMLTQTSDGQVVEPHSISAGLDYPGVGPQLAALAASGRLEVERSTDAQALDAMTWLARQCGIVPALEPAHAIAAAIRLLPRLSRADVVLVNLSGRGDKDLEIMARERPGQLAAVGSPA